MNPMQHWITPDTSNLLIANLPAAEFSELRPCLTRVRLVQGQVLLESGQPTEHIFFVEQGMVSLLAGIIPAHAGVQVAMIGREGMVGGLALLGSQETSTEAAVSQVSGPALRVRTEALEKVLEQAPVLRERCLAYIQAMVRQVMQTAASNANGSLMERCIRWLLMAHDRAPGDELLITQEALSVMLGVRRAGITGATVALQNAGLIRTSRGRISVVDRPGLEEAGHHGFEFDASRIVEAPAAPTDRQA